jgi:hypothetical protein
MPGYSNVHGGNFFHWCIMARLLLDERHGFRAIIIGAKKTSARMKKFEKAVALLRKSIDDEAIGEVVPLPDTAG